MMEWSPSWGVATHTSLGRDSSILKLGEAGVAVRDQLQCMQGTEDTWRAGDAAKNEKVLNPC